MVLNQLSAEIFFLENQETEVFFQFEIIIIFVSSSLS